jgi:alpha-mannosidase
MGLRIQARRGFVAMIGALFFCAARCPAQTTLPSTRPYDFTKQKVLYMVGYAHLDTQWRWSYPQVIAEFLRKTMEDNFRLFEKYPHFIFNFTGANRYMMMKEYFPEDYQKLKKYIAQGRWFTAGSSMEEGDANMPSGEALIRQVLYGNEFFRKEFGEQSTEFMLPDCFGFQASLPSILAHCGLKGFSTQKLTWGSAVGIPFNVGVWTGPDGKGVVAALNPLSYGTEVKDDLSWSFYWLTRLQADAKRCGVMVDYGYYGTGDRGGAPSEDSVSWMEKSIASDGPVHVISARSDQMFNDLTPAEIAKLPRYQGDLLLTNHSAGSLSSQAFVKRLNRKNEQLADAAERASVAADWLGSAVYPREKLASAWRLLLGAHFHDTMAGTMIPKAYEYSWNNLVLALNQFAAVAQDGSGGVISGMDTRAQGTCVVVYNSLSVEREDVAEATISYPHLATAPLSFTVYGPDGNVVPSQVVSSDETSAHILFLARVPAVGWAAFDVRPVDSGANLSELKVGGDFLENSRFRVHVDVDGDIDSIFDKQNRREVLSAPAGLMFMHENPAMYPAWNMDWKDRQAPPRGYVGGPATVKIVESGPVRVALEVTRQAMGSTFVQDIRLAAGDAGDRIEVDSHIDWQTQQSSLRAEFPLTVSNPDAVYQSQTAAVKRGNNNAKKFEVPQQQWFDLDASDGSYGAGILNDCKYGSDKPADDLVRLTLLYTPEAQTGYQDQATQDIGRHQMLYAIAPHAGTWQAGAVPWTAARVNQPLMTFQCSSHGGSLGRMFSMMQTSTGQVEVIALKKAEDGGRIIVRLNELDGEPANQVRLDFASPIVSADEMDGQERRIGPATIEHGHLLFDIQPFGLRTFAVELTPPKTKMTPPSAQPLNLAFNLDAVSTHSNLADGDFDGQGRTYAGEDWPAKLVSEGIPFVLGSDMDGMKNAVACDGQMMAIPPGQQKIYLLASALDGDQTGTFVVGGRRVSLTVQDWSGYIGQWDNRQWAGVIPALTYDWHNKFAGLTPGFIKRDTVAWFSSYRHDRTEGNEYYRFSYLFKYGLDLPPGAETLVLPRNNKIRVFAITAAGNLHDDAEPARPLYDTLEDRAAQSSPAIVPAGGTFNDATWVEIDHPLYWHEGGLHFTTDGSEPTIHSPVYSGKFLMVSSAKIRAREFDAEGNGGPETSAEFAIHDITPPAVKNVEAIDGLGVVRIGFSKPLEKSGAQSPENYLFDDPAVVQSAVLSEDGMNVTLTLSSPLGAGRRQLTVSGVADTSPAANQVTASPIPFEVQQPVYSAATVICPKDAHSQLVAGLPTRGSDPWTMNLFVRASEMPKDHTIIAGFGKCDDSIEGGGRYLCVFNHRVHFWSTDQDVRTATPFEIGKWQMLTATSDGSELTVYKDGKQIAQGEVNLADDDSVVHFGPIDPWDNQRVFAGEIRGLSIWKCAMSSEAVTALDQSFQK